MTPAQGWTVPTGVPGLCADSAPAPPAPVSPQCPKRPLCELRVQSVRTCCLLTARVLKEMRLPGGISEGLPLAGRAVCVALSFPMNSFIHARLWRWLQLKSIAGVLGDPAWPRASRWLPQRSASEPQTGKR